MLEDEMQSYLKELRDNGTLHYREVLMLMEIERIAKIFNAPKTRLASVQYVEWLKGTLGMLEYFRKFIINTAQNKKANDKYEKMVKDFIANPRCTPNERKFLDEIRTNWKLDEDGDLKKLQEPAHFEYHNFIFKSDFPDVNLSELLEP
jgi:hypothetical protein